MVRCYERRVEIMKHIEVWNLIQFPEGYKRICNWVFKTNVTLMTILNVIKSDLL